MDEPRVPVPGRSFRDVRLPRGARDVPRGVDDLGRITGHYGNGADIEHGFLLDHHSFQSVDVPGSLGTDVWDRNLFGVAVGDYEGADQNIYGYSLRNGVFETIDFPARSVRASVASTTLGVIVGFGFNADDSAEHALRQDRRPLSPG